MSAIRKPQFLFLLAAVFAPVILLWPYLAIGVFLLLGMAFVLLVKPPRLVSFWVVFLAVFFFFPYSTINPMVRSTGTYFTLYRKIGGLFSVWDLLLIGLFIILLLFKTQQKHLDFRGFSFPELLFLLGFVLWSFLWGILHISGNLLAYGPTGILRAIIILQVFLYFLAVYLLTLNLLSDQSDWQMAKKWLVRLTGLLVLYGILRLIGILSGKITTMWPFGLPVILYDQMLMLYLPIFAWVAGKILGRRNWKGLGVVAFVSIIFILLSARRFNYILCAAGGLITWILAAWWNGDFLKTTIRSGLKFVLVLGAVTAILFVSFPTVADRITETVQSLNIYRNGEQAAAGSDIRRQEVVNLFKNLNARPYAYALGMGLGTKWKAIAYQPFDSFSFTEKYLRTSLGWFPQFHIPYFSLLYRYGILGIIIFWGGLFLLLGRLFIKLKPLKMSGDAPILLAMIVFLALVLPSFGDSVNPTGFILSGFYLGLLEFRLNFWENRRAD